MSFKELLEKMVNTKNTDERDLLREEIAERYGIYVAMENIGICKVCGKEEDLRYGVCFACANLIDLLHATKGEDMK